MSRVGDIFRAIVSVVTPSLPSPPDRPMTNRLDAQEIKRQAQSLEREARMLGIDVDLERAGR